MRASSSRNPLTPSGEASRADALDRLGTCLADADVVVRARGGDERARGELVRRFLRRACSAALPIVKNVADAEDLAQEAIAAVLERLDECIDPERFAAWLMRAVRNRALNHREQAGARAAILGAIPVADSTSTEGDASGVLLRGRLHGALERLPPLRKQVVLLHDVEAWTHAEIAEELGISVVMSRQHLFVARRALREFLADGIGATFPVVPASGASSPSAA